MSSADPKTRVLFVCSKNQVRSLTAQQVYGARPDLEVRSAGLKDYAQVRLTGELLEWADLVFVFSKRQQRVVQARFRDVADNKQMVCLNLPDRFEYKSPELIQRLTGKLRPYLGSPDGDEATGAMKPAMPACRGTATMSVGGDVDSLLRRLFLHCQNLLSPARDLRSHPSS